LRNGFPDEVALLLEALTGAEIEMGAEIEVTTVAEDFGGLAGAKKSI
jgi:hypothetical protein